MSRNYRFRTLVGAALFALPAALAVADDPATLRSVTICGAVEGPEDALRPVDARDQFPADAAEIHGLIRFEPVTAAFSVRGAWVSVDAISVPNYEIAGVEIPVKVSAAATAHFSISRPNSGWPVGNYLLRVTIGERVVADASFAIVASASPLRAPDTAPAPGAGPSTVYRHPAGFTLSLPAGWTASEADGSTRLSPPNPAGGTDAPSEMHFLAVESIANTGITRPDDAKVLTYLDEEIHKLSPALERTGNPVGLATGLGAGTLLVWKARGRDGQDICARAYATLLDDDRCAMLFGVGLAESIAKREEDLGAIFISLSRAGSNPADGAAGAAPPPPASPPPTATPTDDAALRRKLDALDRAREAGVLSDDKYARKRAELQPAAPALDGAVKAKLAALEAARDAGVLSDGEFDAKRAEILLGLDAPAPAPLATAGPAPAAPADAGGRLRRDVAAEPGQTYRHPVGFSLWYPARWTLSPQEGFLQLVPPDAGTSADGPTEIYVLTGEGVADTGITDPGDARVVAYMDQQVQGLAPFLARKGEPKPAAMDAGRGVVMEWEGANPRGDRITSRSRVSIVKGYAVALTAIGRTEVIEKREPELKRVFASVRLGEGSRDPQLAGTWSYLSSQAMSNPSQYETAWSRANLASDDSTTFVAAPDGSWTRTKRHYMISGAGGTWVESNDVKTDRGQWFAEGGRLTLMGEDGSWEEYDYRLKPTAEGVRLLLVSGGTGELWSRTR